MDERRGSRKEVGISTEPGRTPPSLTTLTSSNNSVILCDPCIMCRDSFHDAGLVDNSWQERTLRWQRYHPYPCHTHIAIRRPYPT